MYTRFLITLLALFGALDAFGQATRKLPQRATDQGFCLQVAPSGTPTDALCIDGANNRVGVGTGTSLSNKFAVWDTLPGTAIVQESYAASSGGTFFSFDKSRNATPGSHTIVQSGDIIGGVTFKGSNGTGFDNSSRILGGIDATPGSSNDMPGYLSFLTATDGTATLTERMKINNAGKVTIGNSTPLSSLNNAGFTPAFQVESATSGNNTTRAASFVHNSADTSPFVFFLGKTRGTTAGSTTVVQSGDNLGSINWQGMDGANFQQAATVAAVVDGTPGTTDMPGRLIFSTSADGANLATERLRIDSSGRVIQGGTAARTDLSNGAETPLWSIESTKSASSEWHSIVQNPGASASGPALFLGKSRASTANGVTVASSGDQMGFLIFGATDGTDMVNGAAIGAHVDGTPGSNDMPGRLTFYTTSDGASAITERMRIDNTGNVGIGTLASATERLQLKNSATDANVALAITNDAKTWNLGVRGDTSDAFAIYDSGAIRMSIHSASGFSEFGTATTVTNGVQSHRFVSGQTGAGNGDITLLAADLDTSTTSDDNAALGIQKGSTTNTTSQVLAKFWINGGSTGSGMITANGASTAAFGSFSDRRLKKNIVNIPSQLSNIMKLRPVEFDYKDGSGHQMGFIAQEMQEVYPDVVSPIDTDKGEYLGIAGWSKTEARLVSAIQELKHENDKLWDYLRKLEKRINEIEGN